MRYVSSAITCAICFATIFSVTGCSDENYDHVISSDVLQFAASVNDAKNVSAEELEAETRAAGQPQKIECATDSLFISPLYETTFRGGLAQKSLEDQDVPKTRGTQISSKSEMTDIGVSCYNGASALFSNIKASKAKGSTANFTLATEQTNFPSDGSSVTYYAYQPFANSSVVYDGNKSIKYTVPNASGTTNADQPDILYACNTSSATDKTIKLNFNHACTAVRFVIGTDLLGGTIKRITLKNVYGSGNLDLSTGAWSNHGTKTSFSTTGSKAVTTSGAALTANGEYFMMIPQTLPSDAAIEIEYSNDYTPNKVLSKTISGTWFAGTTVTYAIGSSTVKVVSSVTTIFPYKFSKTIQTNLVAIPEYPEKKVYTKGDQLGLSIVDGNNKVVLSNYPVTISTDGTKITKGTASAATTTNTLLHRAGYRYFLYYPYNSTYSANIPAVGATNTSTDAATFYANLASNFNLSNTQTSIAQLNQNDLQTGTGVFNSSTRVVSFSSMRHEFGMHSLVQYKLVNTDDPYNFQGDAYANVDYFPLSPHKPYYSQKDDRYFFMVKPSTNTTQFIFHFDNKDYDVAAPAITEADKCNFDGLVPYTMAKSDIYYPDGSLSHYGTRYVTKTPFALVYSTTPTAYEKSEHLTHGEALCLLDCATNVPWLVDNTTNQSILPDWETKFNDVPHGDPTQGSVYDYQTFLYLKSKVNPDNSGLEQYEKMVAKAGNDAFGAVKAFAQQHSDAQGKIFLPSIGELVRAFNTFSNGFFDNYDTSKCRVQTDVQEGLTNPNNHWTEYTYVSGAGQLSSTYNSYVAGAKVKSGEYSLLVDGSSNISYWSSSEYNGTQGMAILFGWNTPPDIYVSGFCSKATLYYVRAAIAF